jgi:hypothetical protein
VGIGIKCFILDENDNLINISITRMNKLLNREPDTKLSEFAGKIVRYVTVIIENQNRKAVSITRIQGHFLQFDKLGKINLSEFDKDMRTAVEMIELPSIIDNDANILYAQSKFAKKRYKQTYTWEITPQIEKKIHDAIFGNPTIRLLK